MTVELTPETEERFLALLRDATVDRLAGDLESARLVSTETGAGLLEMSRKAFLTLMEERGIAPVTLGPRMTRWRLADLKTISTHD